MKSVRRKRENPLNGESGISTMNQMRTIEFLSTDDGFSFLLIWKAIMDQLKWN